MNLSKYVSTLLLSLAVISASVMAADPPKPP